MDLMALADFHLVAYHGGFGQAARASNRSKATLSRRVVELEVDLGVRLIERGAGAIRLTENGRALLASTQGPLAELNEAEDLLRGTGDELRGRLRVSSPLLLGQYAMGAIAARFLSVHPKVRLEIVAEDRYVDLVQEGYDIVIRANPKTDEDLVGRCFVRVGLMVVAPIGLARPESDGDTITTVPAVVRTSGNDAALWTVTDGDVRYLVKPDPVLRVSSLMTMRDAVLNGAGAALLPNYLVKDHLAAGRLARWGEAPGYEVEIWALHASIRLPSRKVRAFVDFLIETFADGTIEGALPDLHPWDARAAIGLMPG